MNFIHLYPLPLAIVTLVLGLIFFGLYAYRRYHKHHLRLEEGLWMAAPLFVIYLFLTIMLAIRWAMLDHAPVYDRSGMMQCMAWLAMFFAFCFGIRTRSALPYGYIVAALALFLSLGGGDEMVAVSSDITRTIGSLHILFYLMAYTLFCFVFFNGILAFSMPDEERHLMRHSSQRMLRYAVSMLIVGLALGTLYSGRTVGEYWTWCPVQVWSLVTIFVYVLPLHDSSLTWLRKPVPFHLYTTLAASTMVVMLIVNS